MVKDWVDLSDGSGPARVVAYVERELPPGGIPAYLAARGSGARSFVLWADEHRRERVATLVTPSATGGVATFQALGAHGELIGTLVREKALRGRGLRTRWTVTQPGRPEAVGFKGRIFWWCTWWLSLPMQLLVLVFSVFDGAPGNEGGVARGPRRIKWRAGGQIPLEFRSRGNKLHVHAPGLDWRLGATPGRPAAHVRRRLVGRQEEVTGRSRRWSRPSPRARPHWPTTPRPRSRRLAQLDHRRQDQTIPDRL